MNQSLALLIVLASAWFLFFLFKGVTYVTDLKTEEALGHLIEKGVVLEYRGYHLYKSQRSQTTTKYVLLRFDAKGNLFHGQDEEFDTASDAISKFMKKTELA